MGFVDRKEHPEKTVVRAGSAGIGDGNFTVIAGPCSVESEEQIMEIAKAVKAAGATMLRGGAFKPRTSPYDFQGLKDKGLAFLKAAGKETGLPVVTEIMGIRELAEFEDVDMIQIGARNMQNYELLREVGRMRKPVLLKRGWANTVRELLMSAEYLMTEGCSQIVLCERGIRTFDDYTRNTLDLSVIPLLHELSHLPVIADPSHGTGLSQLVPPMAMAAAACGADGLIVEVHPDPARALSDGAQSILPGEFAELMKKINRIRDAIV